MVSYLSFGIRADTYKTKLTSPIGRYNWDPVNPMKSRITPWRYVRFSNRK
jgi:hypothetical protein